MPRLLQRGKKALAPVTAAFPSKMSLTGTFIDYVLGK